MIKFRRQGAEVELLGLNEASTTIVDRFGAHDKPGAIDKLMSHSGNQHEPELISLVGTLQSVPVQYRPLVTALG